MSERRKAGVKAYWDSRARDRELAADRVTLPDANQRLLELECLLELLPRGRRVLELGCGNGYSTAVLAAVSREVVAVDNSEAMIERARCEQGALGNVRFERADVLNLPFEPRSFEVVVSQRCLINLVSWEDQQRALIESARVLEPGGSMVLQEGTRQGRDRLNDVRVRVGLSRMGTVAHNLDFDEDRLWDFLRGHFETVDVRRFGVYDLISRVVHPLLVLPREPEYNAAINEVASRVAACLQGLDEVSREFTALLRRTESATCQ